MVIPTILQDIGHKLRYKSGPIFYHLYWSPSHLKFFLQVIWPFSIFTPSDLEAKAKSQVTLNADLETSWVALKSLFVFCIFLNQYMWFYMVCFTTYLQKVVRILCIDKLSAFGPSDLWSHLRKQRQKITQVTWDRTRGQVACQVTWLKIGDRKCALAMWIRYLVYHTILLQSEYETNL